MNKKKSFPATTENIFKQREKKNVSGGVQNVHITKYGA